MDAADGAARALRAGVHRPESAHRRRRGVREVPRGVQLDDNLRGLELRDRALHLPLRHEDGEGAAGVPAVQFLVPTRPDPRVQHRVLRAESIIVPEAHPQLVRSVFERAVGSAVHDMVLSGAGSDRRPFVSHLLTTDQRTRRSVVDCCFDVVPRHVLRVETHLVANNGY